MRSIAMRTGRAVVLGALLIGAIMALAGCGSDSSKSKNVGEGKTASTSSVAGVPGAPTVAAESVAVSATGQKFAPSTVVARVGNHAITQAAYAHAYLAQLKQEKLTGYPPLPPGYAACVSRLKVAPVSPGASEPSSSAPTSAATLKAECGRLYAAMQTRALDGLILPVWLAAGASEVGAMVSPQAVQAQLEKEEHNEPPLSKFEKTLAASGRTVADFAAEIREQLLAEAIRERLKQKTEHVSEAQVASYYQQHKSVFGIPQRRVLEIVRAGSLAEALKLKRELASGTSFASLAKKLPLEQPIYSTDGVVPAYESNMYQEPILNNAILAAKLNTLSGPIRISIGFYVFEVKKITPAQQRSLAQSRASIKEQLPGLLYEQTLEAFVKQWRARWTARTDCQPGYVVAKCSQYVRPGNALPENPHGLE